MSDQPFSTVAILGLGAMGGSLARALSGLDAPPEVAGWSPSAEERAAAVAARVLAAAPDAWQEAVRDAELVVLAAPLAASCGLVAEVVETMPTEATLTDVASLKAPMSAAVAEAGASSRWVGSHPMTGSEESGFTASRSGLYEGATVWTVAGPSASERVPGVHAFWRVIGSRPVAIGAEEHDRLMALVSQLPQLTANALATVLAEGGVTPDQLGPGGADMTRLAASGSSMWRDILEHASPELSAGVRALASTLTEVAERLDRGDLDGLEDMMEATRAWVRRP